MDAGYLTLQTGQTFRGFLDDAKRNYVLFHLRANDWNITATARAIDTARSNLNKMIVAYGLKRGT